MSRKKPGMRRRCVRVCVRGQFGAIGGRLGDALSLTRTTPSLSHPNSDDKEKRKQGQQILYD